MATVHNDTTVAGPTVVSEERGTEAFEKALAAGTDDTFTSGTANLIPLMTYTDCVMTGKTVADEPAS